MEFQNVGKHCDESTCHQKDFLPFNCQFCNKTFCLEHRDVTSHACAKTHSGDNRAIICPVCLKTLKFDAGSTTGDEYWNMHFATECKQENYAKAKSDKSKICDSKGCREKLTILNTYNCKTCRRELCLKHRFEDQHECGYNPAENNRPNRYDKLGGQDGQNKTNNKNSGIKNTLLNFFNLAGGSNNKKPQQQQNSPPKQQQQNSPPKQQQSPPPRQQQNNNSNNSPCQEVCGICSKKFGSLEELISHAEKTHY